ncbi:MAG: secondary thiamine-phosphate synthase enzyme YjbQ [Actinomycetota bacterium]|jgi:secondary thiamine-phosphate synthase enzyme|nr:secondary thiamine-phosphate synthase enzyme YjbQ [Actinomycetota bacterium]
MFESLIIKTSRRIEMVDITENIEDIIARNNIKNGICCLFVPHTTAGITVNENADPTVQMDINSKLSSLIPVDENYSHLEGNSDSHIKSILVGQSVNIIIDGGKPALGTWQGIYFCEFDGPGNRKIFIKLIEG